MSDAMRVDVRIDMREYLVKGVCNGAWGTTATTTGGRVHRLEVLQHAKSAFDHRRQAGARTLHGLGIGLRISRQRIVGQLEYTIDHLAYG